VYCPVLSLRLFGPLGPDRNRSDSRDQLKLAIAQRTKNRNFRFAQVPELFASRIL
jgi:hypothetical protein